MLEMKYLMSQMKVQWKALTTESEKRKSDLDKSLEMIDSQKERQKWY